MELDILYKNAMFFKKYILPFYFIFRTKSGDIVVKVDESDFSHLVGKQHSSDEDILKMKARDFWSKTLNEDIDIVNLLGSTDVNTFTVKQRYIYNKNVQFINVFRSLLKQINLKIYSKNFQTVLDDFDCDYHHNQIFYNTDGSTIEKMNVLGIIGDLYTDKFYFNSIKHIVEKNEIHKYLKSKPLNVFEIQLIKKADFDNYQKTFEYRIKESPRAHKKKNATKYVNKRLSKKDIVKVNSLLKHEHLRIEYGKYGKNTIQVYSNEVLIESKLRIDIDMYCKKPVDLAGYIVKVFKR